MITMFKSLGVSILLGRGAGEGEATGHCFLHFLTNPNLKIT